MKDEIIEFKTAKLAKERGFKENSVYMVYNPNGKIINLFHPQLEGFIATQAPTQSLLQRWLREVHNLHVNLNLRSSHNYLLNIYSKEEEVGIRTQRKEKYLNIHKTSEELNNSYEQSLEIGLQEALKLIKDA